MNGLPPIGDARLTLHLRHQQLVAQQSIAIAQAVRESDSVFTRPSIATAAGDERKLRGIPAIGRGVSGCIPGTSPHAIRD